MAVGIINAIPGIVAKIPQVIRALIGAFSSMRSQFTSIGADLIRGLWNGISSVRSWIMGKISGFVSGITGGIKKFFGIKSPSKVMADEVGKWIPVGLADGIEKNVRPVTDAMEELTDLTTGTIASEIAMSTTSSFGANTMISGNPQRIINVYNENNSPEPLTEREIARQTKLSLQRIAYNL